MRQNDEDILRRIEFLHLLHTLHCFQPVQRHSILYRVGRQMVERLRCRSLGVNVEIQRAWTCDLWTLKEARMYWRGSDVVGKWGVRCWSELAGVVAAVSAEEDERGRRGGCAC